MSNRRYIGLLAAAYLIIWIMLAINPLYPKDWLLENVLIFIGVPIVALGAYRSPLSRLSYTLIFIYLCLHALGAHYTYSEVPYDHWIQNLTGGHSLDAAMGWQRNHFDRFVHFSYGLLLTYPIRELFMRHVVAQGFWSYLLTFSLTMSVPMLYELIEWGAAIIFGGDLGIAYLGTQGDIWDAQKDMAFASLGTLVAMTLTACLNAMQFQPNPAKQL